MGQLTQQMKDDILTEKANKGNTELGLSELEIDALAESVNISMGAAAKALSSIFNLKVAISTPSVTIKNREEIGYKSMAPAMVVSIEYVEGLTGVNYFIIKQSDVKKIATIMMGQPIAEDDGTEPDELHISAISEVMNQMMGAASTALATFFNTKINISTPECRALVANDDSCNIGIQGDSVVITLKIAIGDIFDGEFINIMPMTFAKKLAENLINVQLPRQTNAAWNIHEQSKKEEPKQKNRKEQRSETIMPKDKKVSTVKFSDFDSDTQNTTVPASNLDLIMDVPLDIVVQIGKTQRLLKDIVKLTQGSIIELEKQAGDPVDILVNGEMIARGDVVVIDDNFGVRITEIVNKKG
ncbi:MAG: flagellar motor switch phosphatase FliY [Clostridiales bacterium]|nr:flagellar motor switch phosphatase FliY [Clostridiales bacterium]